MATDKSESESPLFKRVWRKIIGAPRSVQDTSIFHKISLIPLLAWIGLGADGLSSSSYGPEEAFRALSTHKYLAIFLALATSLTVLIISYAYSRIIEHFPTGGGGYIVATHTLGKNAGVLSGCALIVDYMLTITVSLVSCGDALFSFLPIEFQRYKLFFVICLIIFLVILNLRGVKESVIILAPIFIIFVVTHIWLIAQGLITHSGQIAPLTTEFKTNFSQDVSTLGYVGMLAIFLRAFSLGGGTYTGIEAVSNGLPIMREPKVHTGKRTMAYMATSLAVTAGGLFFCYFLFNINPVQGRTLNAVLADNTFRNMPLGKWIALVTILSEGALLIVGSQTGFIDGPRVMANMATDAWLPRRFSALSERLTMQNGVLLMGSAALLLLLYAHGSVSVLVVMYSINVFMTFCLSESGMVRFFISNRKREKQWKRHISVHLTGLTLCLTILTITVIEKFEAGGWVTLLITSIAIGSCYVIRRHYLKVSKGVRKLEEILSDLPSSSPFNNASVDPKEMTAILLVSGFSGFGLHTFLSIHRNFPNVYKNFIFVSVAEIDSGAFKGTAEIEALTGSVKNDLSKYVQITRKNGFPADYRMDVGTDVVETATHLVEGIVKEFPKCTVFTGKLIFRQEHPFQKILHNETAFAIQRRLQWVGISTVILPIRVNL